MRNVIRSLLAATAAITISSAGCSSMKPGSLASVAPVTQNDRVGSVYLFRGWIGVFSTGIDQLGQQLNDQGVHADVFQDTQAGALAAAMIEQYEGHPDHEPIVLIGHSYGADDTIAVLRKLAEHHIDVALVVTLDPVTPGKVTGNAQRVYNLYQSSALDGMPFFRGIPLTPDSPGPAELKNMNIRTDRKDLLDGGIDHFNIEKKPKIHADVIAQVMAACPPRAAWTATRGPANAVASARLTAGPDASTPTGLIVTSARASAAPVQLTSVSDAGGH